MGGKKRGGAEWIIFFFLGLRGRRGKELLLLIGEGEKNVLLPSGGELKHSFSPFSEGEAMVNQRHRPGKGRVGENPIQSYYSLPFR